MERQDLSPLSQSGNNDLMENADMNKGLYPDAQDFMEVFSSVVSYDADQALYKCSIKAEDKSELDLTFSINDLSTTIKVNASDGSRITSFYSEFVDFIRINESEKSIFLSICGGLRSNQTVLVKTEGHISLDINSLKK